MPLSVRDPIHGFIRADPLEAALVSSPPLQRLRSIRQLGLAHLVFPGAEHSRFCHVLGAMELAGRVYDAVAAKSDGLLPTELRSLERRAVRAAALVHDLGHAPFSHSAEELFEGGIDHEQMTRNMLTLPEVEAAFEHHGEGLTVDHVVALLTGGRSDVERLLAQIISGELDADKMDYLLRDSLHCGVRYGTYDLDRLLDTIEPIEDPETGQWGLGVEEGGVHALEALVMARYYMFTQVYFNVTGKAMELHLNEWLEETGRLWPADPQAFLAHDDITATVEMRACDSVHARAITEREQFPLAYEFKEHLTSADHATVDRLLAEMRERHGNGNLLVSYSSKDPHRMGASRVFVRSRFDGLQPMEEASGFIRHLGRIERCRIYAPSELTAEVQATIDQAFG